MVLMPSVAVYESDDINKMPTEILQDIVAEIAYANTGILDLAVYTIRFMIRLLGIG